MNSPELPLWQRVTTAILLVAAAWFVRGSDTLLGYAGGSAIRLSAGVAAISVILGMKIRLGMWPTRLRRHEFSMPAALGVAAVGALLIALFGRGGTAASLWTGDRGGVLVVLAGAAALAVSAGQSRVHKIWRWLAAAAVVGLLPWAIGLISLRVGDWTVVSLDGKMLLDSIFFFVVVNILTLLVTDELAFRRLVVGRVDSGLAMVIAGAFVYGVWTTFLPAGPGGPFAGFLTGVATGTVAGALYVLSQSLLVSAVFSGVAVGGVAATLQALRAGGTQEEHLLSFVNGASAVTAIAAVALGVVVFRKLGLGMVGEYSVREDAAGS